MSSLKGVKSGCGCAVAVLIALLFVSIAAVVLGVAVRVFRWVGGV